MKITTAPPPQRMDDAGVHAALLEVSSGYREFYEHEVQEHAEMMPWDTDPDPQRMVRAFAGWLVTGTVPERFAAWSAEQFRLEMEHWES